MKLLSVSTLSIFGSLNKILTTFKDKGSWKIKTNHFSLMNHISSNLMHWTRAFFYNHSAQWKNMQTEVKYTHSSISMERSCEIMSLYSRNLWLTDSIIIFRIPFLMQHWILFDFEWNAQKRRQCNNGLVDETIKCVSLCLSFYLLCFFILFNSILYNCSLTKWPKHV